jgi:hypothetical protein
MSFVNSKKCFLNSALDRGPHAILYIRSQMLSEGEANFCWSHPLGYWIKIWPTAKQVPKKDSY